METTKNLWEFMTIIWKSLEPFFEVKLVKNSTFEGERGFHLLSHSDDYYQLRLLVT